MYNNRSFYKEKEPNRKTYQIVPRRIYRKLRTCRRINVHYEPRELLVWLIGRERWGRVYRERYKGIEFSVNSAVLGRS